MMIPRRPPTSEFTIHLKKNISGLSPSVNRHMPLKLRYIMVMQHIVLTRHESSEVVPSPSAMIVVEAAASIVVYISQ